MNRLKTLLAIVFGGLRYRKLRSALTTVGIFIGIVVVVALIFLGQGLRNAVSAQLRQFGADLLIAVPRDITNPFASLLDHGEFRDRDIAAVAAIDGVAKIMPTSEGKIAVAEFRGERKNVSLHGQPWALISTIFEESQGFRIASGAWPEREEAREIVLGAQFARTAFSRPVGLNDTLVIKGRAYVVTGILRELGEPNHDNSVFISMAMMRKVLGRHDGFSVMLIKAEPGASLTELSADVERVLGAQKGLEQFSVLTPDKASQIVGDVIGVIELVLFLVAAVAVVIGGIGIMNSMYTSVLERTREIGIMKAIGATNAHVIGLFLLESGIFGLVGGVAGCLGGVALAKAVEAIANGYGIALLKVAFDGLIIGQVLLYTFIVGVIAGVLPAFEAARLNPSVALRQR
ncbi:ABC transporter permease [Candidatus Uhrbacteria bacterium]|nr:ABC transporter permease [Candidatus Uhrbacteria bacterium]